MNIIFHVVCTTFYSIIILTYEYLWSNLKNILGKGCSHFLYNLTRHFDPQQQAFGLNHYGLWAYLILWKSRVLVHTSYLSKWERPHSNVVAMIWHQKLWEWSLSTKLVMAKNISLQKYRLRFYFFYYIWVSQSTFFFGVENAMNILLKISPFWKLYQFNFFYLHK